MTTEEGSTTCVTTTCVTLYDSTRAEPEGRSALRDLVVSLLDGGMRVRVAIMRSDEITPGDDSHLQAEWTGGPALRTVSAGDDQAGKERETEIGIPEFLSKARRLRDERRRSLPDWPAWFPVLDRERCTDCKQCLNFCLFDVYAVDDEGHVQVRNPANCKNKCPACARVCPVAAIIFPKYPDAPINGAEVDEAALKRESMTADLPSLLRGGVADALRRRSDSAKKRFSRERDQEQALKERCNCLVQLQGQLGVPPQVIESISVDELRTKAAEKLTSGQDPEGKQRDHKCS